MSRTNSSVRRDTGSGITSPGAMFAEQEVGKYRVLAELGRGGMANVFLAVAQGAGAVNKLVVLKALLPEVAAEPQALTMFLDEARLAVLLNHGNVVQTYEVGVEGDRHVIVMEYLEGQALASVVRRGERTGQPLALGLHLRVLISVLEGLHYAHELRAYDGKPLQLVHRDISPQNVFVTYDGRTKVLDFGIAKAATSTTHTATGLVKGKIAYMSPEQLSGESVDRRADVYSVGCMLWAAVAGTKLWKDVADAQILRKVLEGDIPSPRSVQPNCDAELERIIMKALAPERDARHATARELQEDLERYCDQMGAPDRPRELARCVSTLFAKDQANLKARIEEQLSRLETSAATPAERSRSLVISVTDAQQAVSSTQTISASSLNHPEDARNPRKLAPWLIGAGLVVLLLGGYALQRNAHPPGTQAAAAPVPSLKAVASEPASVKVALRAVPSEAQLYLDDQPLAGNPALRVLPNDGKVHQLRAELAGHQTASAEFIAAANDVVELRLEALQVPKKKATAPIAAPRKPSKKPSSSGGCAQPFFVDSDGIKKVRPGCL